MRFSAMAFSILLVSVAASAKPVAAAEACPLQEEDPIACLEKQFADRDKALNVRYAALLKTLDPTGQAALKKAEKAWIAFRDAHCDFIAPPEVGASLVSRLRPDCLARLTDERIKQLDDEAAR